MWAAGLRALARGARRSGSLHAEQLQQLRWLNIHEYQVQWAPPLYVHALTVCQTTLAATSIRTCNRDGCCVCSPLGLFRSQLCVIHVSTVPGEVFALVSHSLLRMGGAWPPRYTLICSFMRARALARTTCRNACCLENQPFEQRNLGHSLFCRPMQGAELMSKYGVNVPPGIPVFKVDEVKAAAEKMASPDGEVRGRLPRVLCPNPSPCKAWEARVSCICTGYAPCNLYLCCRGVWSYCVVSGRLSGKATGGCVTTQMWRARAVWAVLPCRELTSSAAGMTAGCDNGADPGERAGPQLLHDQCIRLCCGRGGRWW